MYSYLPFHIFKKKLCICNLYERETYGIFNYALVGYVQNLSCHAFFCPFYSAKNFALSSIQPGTVR